LPAATRVRLPARIEVGPPGVEIVAVIASMLSSSPRIERPSG
jgi:hypothetical protein